MRLTQITGLHRPPEKPVNYFVLLTAATAALAGLLFGWIERDLRAGRPLRQLGKDLPVVATAKRDRAAHGHV